MKHSLTSGTLRYDRQDSTPLNSSSINSNTGFFRYSLSHSDRNYLLSLNSGLSTLCRRHLSNLGRSLIQSFATLGLSSGQVKFPILSIPLRFRGVWNIRHIIPALLFKSNKLQRLRQVPIIKSFLSDPHLRVTLSEQGFYHSILYLSSRNYLLAESSKNFFRSYDVL